MFRDDGSEESAWPTLWTSLFDLTNQAIYFTHNMARNDFWIDMRKLNFSPGAPVLYLKADRTDLFGDVSRLLSPQHSRLYCFYFFRTKPKAEGCTCAASKEFRVMRLSLVSSLTVVVISLVVFLPFHHVEACSRIFWNSNGQAMLVARNMDLEDYPVIYVMPAGISKEGETETAIRLSGLPSTAAL